MNKDLRDRLPAGEQPVAAKLDTVAQDMKLSPGFQWELENQLMEAYTTRARSAQGWQSRILPALGWAVVLIAGVFLLNWALRSQPPKTSLAEPITAAPQISFADRVRQGDVCEGSLALAHGFDVFLTSKDKTEFVPVNTGNSLDELRSFAWSADGERLAVVGNTTGSGNIYIIDPTGEETGYLLSASEAGYVRDAAWSRDGRQFVLWSSQNLTTLYLLSALGHGLIEKPLAVQIVGAPQFAPDGNIVFYGMDGSAAGLFTVSPEPAEPFLLIHSVEGEGGWALSPDGSLLAYMEHARDEGEARLLMKNLSMGSIELLATLPIPRGSGASLPQTANLNWSADGAILAFDFGLYQSDRAIYLAYTDGSGLVKAAEGGHAPAISSDGRCLAYISNEQVLLLDLNQVSSTSATAAPVFLADLPAGRGRADSRLDKLQWQP